MELNLDLKDLPLPPSIVEELSEFAERLRADQDGLPVFLRSICNELGIRIRREARVPDGKAYLSWNRAAKSEPMILLPLKSHDRWDRFCAAHELGHYFLVAKYEWMPTESKTYWQTEELCDFFARQLLLPAKHLLGAAVDIKDARSHLSRCERLAAKTIVPWREVATAISAHEPVVFFSVERSARGGLRVQSSSLPKRPGKHAELPLSALGVQAMEGAMRDASENRVPIDVELKASQFRGTKLHPLFRRLGITDLIARIVPQSERIKIAAMMPASA